MYNHVAVIYVKKSLNPIKFSLKTKIMPNVVKKMLIHNSLEASGFFKLFLSNHSQLNLA